MWCIFPTHLEALQIRECPHHPAAAPSKKILRHIAGKSHIQLLAALVSFINKDNITQMENHQTS